MAEIKPDDVEDIQKGVSKGLKRGYLIIFGVIFVVLIVLMITSWGSISGLFKGMLGRPGMDLGEVGEELEEDLTTKKEIEVTGIEKEPLVEEGKIAGEDLIGVIEKEGMTAEELGMEIDETKIAEEEYEYNIKNMSVFSGEDECEVGDRCSLRLRIERTGTIYPTENPRIYVNIDDVDIIPAGLEITGFKGLAGVTEKQYETGIVILDAEDKPYRIEVTVGDENSEDTFILVDYRPAQPEAEVLEEEGFTISIDGIDVIDEQGNSCEIGEDCDLRINIEKVGAGVPETTPTVSVIVNNSIIGTEEEIDGLEVAQDASLAYNFPDPIITSAEAAAYDIIISIKEGTSVLAIFSQSITIEEEAEEEPPEEEPPPEEEEEEEEPPPEEEEEEEEPPPEEEEEEEPEPEPEPEYIPEPEIEVEILEADVDPQEFNPLLEETKISYEISAGALMEVEVENAQGLTVVNLVEDEELEEGEHYVWWNGTDEVGTLGEVVSPGIYTYKIVAKDPNTEEVKDTKSGVIYAAYQVAAVDFEEIPGVTEAALAAETQAPPPPVTQQAAATVALQETQEGVTAGTGPGVLIYLLLPAGGYFFSRKKVNK